MNQGVLLLIIIVFYTWLAIMQTADKKQRKQFYSDKAREHSMKGEREQADRYIELMSRMR